ncbi:Na+/H+ antiporter NhaC family protein [Halomonas elongata]|uniref:Na+/H+ antiporter NhaC family protein n=1 Tax=Halomonas elongata (strain ATCC 33173 / DSM 2581 / NBRC 15536 / NCIMB 2198 / 1H9) TaxID=768066 RepID=E1V4D2_HALED|nr:Na+/H+ antiporter NhaC family protein [Halomonas elongata]MDL4860979.1 Na+/H+ antiporter NhaC family protein [Halomonas elongata]WBF18210.1 Na+/H+ antiporter NhaC family protein [Halomonas elongata]WPU47061.1 Na+/H+ antiporter NhaC family protein [Halomonas elongata DSM 2581]CBV40969.1 NhaC family sodium/proton antiporter domain protein [Halomonas elongata DSM 2581]
MSFGPFSLLPPVLAIVLALATRNVIPALFCGVWLGATMLSGGNPAAGLYASFNDFIIPSVGDEWSVTVLIYCGLFGVLIMVLQRTGGAQAIARAISERVASRRGAQGATLGLGVLIFFEDYFNALTVGSVMRPITDRMRVSREKLAYIVDSTSAPMCLLGPVSTWVVFVMGLIGTQLTEMNISGSEYLIYLSSIPLNFYAWLALGLIAFIVITQWDFGPMARAEHRARTTGEVLAKDATPPSDREVAEMEVIPEAQARKRNMLVPIGVLVLMIPPMFLWTGNYPENDLVTAVGEANGGLSILIATFVAVVVGLVMGMQQKLFDFRESMDIVVSGIKSMTLVYIILTLAWSIGSVTSELGTADYLVTLAEANIAPSLVPVLLFLIGALVAFTTGTSYGTFAIMIPIAMPVAMAMDLSLSLAIAAVLSGGIFGDHCSPISDTTILSSAGSSCDHIDHVRTQLPYAISAGLAGILAFFVAGLTDSALIGGLAGAGALVTTVVLLRLLWGGVKSRDEALAD